MVGVNQTYALVALLTLETVCCAYQALRMTNFMSQPSLEAIQTLLIIGNVLSYNMNPGCSYILSGTSFYIYTYCESYPLFRNDYPNGFRSGFAERFSPLLRNRKMEKSSSLVGTGLARLPFQHVL